MAHILGPVVVGGVGGSGTRVLAQILSDLGFFMGEDLNTEGDNLWFTLLFKRPGWYQKAHKNKEKVFEGLRILANAMTRSAHPTPSEMVFVLRAASWMALNGHNRSGDGKGMWPLIRARKLLFSRKELPSGFRGWGWKEPNSHIYLEYMAEYFKHFRYIHAVRHGIDMAFSGNQQQLFNWGPIYGIEKPADITDVASASLKYWIKANQRALEIGDGLGPDKFLLVNFDELCASPKTKIETIIQFLNVQTDETTLERLCMIPKTPQSMGRYLNYDLSGFDAESISAVRNFGFHVDITH